MRIEAYNAVSQIYQSNSAAASRKSDMASSSSDSIEFSQTAKNYQTAKAAVSSAADIREDKVARIKAQMAAGTYNISLEAVADKILGGIGVLAF